MTVGALDMMKQYSDKYITKTVALTSIQNIQKITLPIVAHILHKTLLNTMKI